MKTYNKLKIWQGAILLVLSIVEIFWISGYFSGAVGLYGTLASEFLLLLMALLTVFFAGADYHRVFPIHQISIAGVGGTVLLWLGSFLIMMIVDLIIMAFFPAQMGAVSSGLNEAFQSVPFRISFFIVAIIPAICEEAVFRGVILHSLNPARHKWIAIIVTGLLFGACHGSIWRLFPTALLGIVMGYILMETDNMVYNGIFHCINNAVPIILLFLTQNAASTVDTGTMLTSGAVWMSVGAYLILGAAIPFSLYIGNYLIHYKQPGFRTSLFPEERHWIIGVLIISSIAFVVLGMVIMGVGICVKN